ncbi:proton-conducting membrane transporter [Pyrococcus furiosus DSM 3638]|uniref:Proton-conducting membrane transporter n=3 Tax=Pyrococcus furiosus TaxID=2261 RepID=A0A5C0XPC6_PYRFU|nr:proton-conducting transporter membrane subunit [Pyrococcus furiosus]6U8Y_H Chain H, NADH dehydrogenase subunit N [Pyrococcus furiosus COM1]6U8Y_h Chain h, NADH dehydrogenase subunit N [Pyrococcus furiosus COM1]AAL81571.1 NADH dehydrogenase subunit [Pyrococcus furiosus DSM 3638]AFN04230.1 NADH dehydrogenase subunit N [Pyrococcus furiosus COM1]QEK79076.1 proton-conducting membrane transporter [Pyrococcus furiosus DSM 3638]
MSQVAALLIALPLISAFFVPVLKQIGKSLIKPFLVIITLLQTLIASWAFVQVYSTGKPIIIYAGGWKPPIGINLYIGHFAALFILVIAVVSFLMALFNFKAVTVEPIDKYAMLFLLLLLGATGMIATGDIFNLFVFMEITAISAYALTAYNKTGEAAEASMKYIVLGGIGSSFFLVGVALIYGATGTLNMAHLAMLANDINPTVVQVGLALIIFGLAVEAELFPLNAWAPDAYQAAPHPITVMFSAFVVKAGLYAMARILYLFKDVSGWSSLTKLLIAMATLTVVFAELSALRQKNVKRMIAYSSIGQVGLIALALSLGTQEGVSAGVFHMLNHAIVKTMMFMAIGYVGITLGGTMIENFEGLGKRMPLTSLSLTIGGIATVGVPLFNVFWSKLRIILAAAHEGNLWPVALVLFASVVEAVYYFRLIHTMWFKGKSGERIPEGAIAIVLLLLAMLIIVIGVYPTPFWNLVTKAGSDIVEVSKYVANVLPGVKL